MPEPSMTASVAHIFTEEMDAFMRAGTADLREAVTRHVDVEALLAETIGAGEAEMGARDEARRLGVEAESSEAVGAA